MVVTSVVWPHGVRRGEIRKSGTNQALEKPCIRRSVQDRSLLSGMLLLHNVQWTDRMFSLLGGRAGMVDVSTE